ncbi:hypothetical protein ACTMS0_01675 [Micromonospora sp. H33]|uniref:hypothetical protein n=1 Tax=Micromonospora sp. H33 TaxID=3452215 RepID=UPI003F8ADC9C
MTSTGNDTLRVLGADRDLEERLSAELTTSKSLVTEPAAAVRLVALVELTADAVEAGRAYEDRVLGLLARHGGRVERRLRTGDGRSEVHVIRFDTRAGYDSFLADPERVALRADLGDAAPTSRVLEVQEV